MKRILYLLLISAPIFSMQQPTKKFQSSVNDKRLPSDTKKIVTTVLNTGAPLSPLTIATASLASLIMPLPTIVFWAGIGTAVGTHAVINHCLNNKNNNNDNKDK
jgi:hypothetical protein